MASKPELVIPLRMDMAEALRGINAVMARVEKLNQETKEGMQGSAKEAKSFGSVLTDLATHQGYQMAKDLAAGMANSFRETHNYVKGLSEDFVKAQQSMQEISALMNKPNSDLFTAQQAKQAGAANLGVDEWVKFQESFQSFGGAFIEKLKGGEQAQLSYQQKAAEFAKARGAPPAQIAELAGAVLEFSPGELTSDEALAQIGKVYGTLERSRTPVAQLLPQLPRLMAQGSSATDAAQLLTLASSFAPGEEGTYVENTLKALTSAELEGRGDELGLKEGMTPLEQIKAASAKIDDRVKAGENEKAVIQEYFGDIRERKGAKGFLNRGLRAKGFERVEGYIGDTPDDFVSAKIQDWRESDAGRRAALIADESVARTERGLEVADLAEERMRAKNELIREGRFEQTTWGDTAREIFGLSALGFQDKEDHLVSARAHANVMKRAGLEAPSETALEATPTTSLNAASMEYLRDMAQSNRRMLELTEKASEKEGVRPLVAPAPRVARAPGS